MTKIRNCVTHHYACDCREEKFRKMEYERDEYRKLLINLVVSGEVKVEHTRKILAKYEEGER